jgi:hypothetical protein
MTLVPASYVEVQQKLFKTYGMAVGMVETLALLTTVGSWLLDHAWLVGLAASPMPQ